MWLTSVPRKGRHARESQSQNRASMNASSSLVLLPDSYTLCFQASEDCFDNTVVFNEMTARRVRSKICFGQKTAWCKSSPQTDQ